MKVNSSQNESFDQLQNVMTHNINKDLIIVVFARLGSDLTCLNVYKCRDDCTLTNRAITRIILRSVNSGCCITSDTALQSVPQAVMESQDSVPSDGKSRDRSREIFVPSQIPAATIDSPSIRVQLKHQRFDACLQLTL